MNAKVALLMCLGMLGLSVLYTIVYCSYLTRPQLETRIETRVVETADGKFVPVPELDSQISELKKRLDRITSKAGSTPKELLEINQERIDDDIGKRGWEFIVKEQSHVRVAYKVVAGDQVYCWVESSNSTILGLSNFTLGSGKETGNVIQKYAAVSSDKQCVLDPGKYHVWFDVPRTMSSDWSTVDATVSAIALDNELDSIRSRLFKVESYVQEILKSYR